MTGITYSDDFIKITSDISLVADRIRRSILTSPGERVQNYNFGSKFLGYLFQFEPVIKQDIIAELTKIAGKVIPSDYEASNYIIETDYENHKLTVTYDLKSKTTNEVVQISEDFLEDTE
jgi:hypothetical protein